MKTYKDIQITQQQFMKPHGRPQAHRFFYNLAKTLKRPLGRLSTLSLLGLFLAFSEANAQDSRLKITRYESGSSIGAGKVKRIDYDLPQGPTIDYIFADDDAVNVGTVRPLLQTKVVRWPSTLGVDGRRVNVREPTQRANASDLLIATLLQPLADLPTLAEVIRDYCKATAKDAEWTKQQEQAHCFLFASRFWREVWLAEGASLATKDPAFLRAYRQATGLTTIVWSSGWDALKPANKQFTANPEQAIANLIVATREVYRQRLEMPPSGQWIRKSTSNANVQEWLARAVGASRQCNPWLRDELTTLLVDDGIRLLDRPRPIFWWWAPTVSLSLTKPQVTLVTPQAIALLEEGNVRGFTRSWMYAPFSQVRERFIRPTSGLDLTTLGLEGSASRAFPRPYAKSIEKPELALLMALTYFQGKQKQWQLPGYKDTLLDVEVILSLERAPRYDWSPRISRALSVDVWREFLRYATEALVIPALQASDRSAAFYAIDRLAPCL